MRKDQIRGFQVSLDFLSRVTRGKGSRWGEEGSRSSADLDYSFLPQHIIEELTRENSTSAAQLYALKNEKDQLLAETEDLRDVSSLSLSRRFFPHDLSFIPSRRLTYSHFLILQAVKTLELAMEESILQEEGKLDAEAAGAGLQPPPSTNGAPSSPSLDAARLAKQLAEAQVALDSQSRRHDVSSFVFSPSLESRC